MYLVGCVLYDLVFSVCYYFFFFFFKQKTAYEMRISDWSSDVCSSDLIAVVHVSLSLKPALDAIGQAIDQRFDRLLAIPDDARRSLYEAKIGRASCRERVCQYV